MSIRAKVVSIVAAASLVAGAGLAVATPAQAKNKVQGNTQITLDKGVVAALSSAGLSVNVTKPGKAKGAKLTFPVTGVGDGFIQHKGTLEFVKDGQVAVSASDPIIEWPTDVPLSTAVVKVTTALGVLPLFDITNFKATKPKTKVDKKKKERKTTTTYRGTLSLTSDEFVVNTLNTILGSTLLVPGMKMGSIKTAAVVVAKCKNKACTR
jgi:hypothetical protein